MAMVEEFIRRRFRPDEHWFTGNCYQFAYILKGRFPDAEIFYDEVEGHFTARISGSFFDASGRYKPEKEDNMISFAELERSDPERYKRIVKGCIL